MRAAAKRRGIQITSLSRPIRPSDFRDFDLILAMDKQNKGRRRSIICIFIYESFQKIWILSFWVLNCIEIGIEKKIVSNKVKEHHLQGQKQNIIPNVEFAYLRGN